MANLESVRVQSVHHWNDTLFSFRTSRNPSFKFKNGHFIMLGMEVDGRPLMRAYSIASANHETYLEFFSIKIKDGKLTSKLQKIDVGDELFISKKSTGTLIQDNLLPGKNLYMLSTGTGLAPFLSLIKCLDVYDNFDNVILTHGVRYISELAYADYITNELSNHEYFGEMVKDKLQYYPTVTRESFRRQGRLTQLLKSGQISEELGLPKLNLENDRFMICGSMSMIKDITKILDDIGFKETRAGKLGHYVIERAFVE